MAWNRNGTWSVGRNPGPGLTWRVGEHSPSNRRPATSMGSRYTQVEISNDKDQDKIKLFNALTVIKRIRMEEIKPLLLKGTTATATNGLFGNDSGVQWAECTGWKMEYSDLKTDRQMKYSDLDTFWQMKYSDLDKIWQMKYSDLDTFWQMKHSDLDKIWQLKYSDLEFSYHELEQKMVTIETAFANENKKQMRILRETKQVNVEKNNKMSRLERYVELVDEESKCLRAQLQDKEMQLLKQKQGRLMNMEYEEFQMKHKALQRKLDKAENEYQAMMMDKKKVENENEELRGTLKKTEHNLSAQKSEISRLIKRIESVDKESESLNEQLRETNRNLNIEKEQLEMRNKDLQHNIDKIQNDYQSMAMYKTKLENEIRIPKSTLRKTEHDVPEKTSEIYRYKQRVDSVDQETKSLKIQLQEKEMHLLKQKKVIEQLELRHNDLQQKFDKIKGEYHLMVIDKIKFENENKKLIVMLRKTEHESSEQKIEISRHKKHVESADEESKSLKTELQEKEIELLEQKQGRNFNVENEQLDLRHKDLQRKFDQIKDEYQSMLTVKTKLENENENLMSILGKTEQEISEKTNEISRLKKRVETVDEETNSLKEQLHKKEIQLQQLTQTKTWNVEYEQLELRQKDLQRQSDKIKDEYQSMVKDKTKLENENKKLMSMLTKTKQEISEKTDEIARLKKDVESWVHQSTSLKTQLQENEMQLINQKQERHLNVEHEQLRIRNNELQQKFDKIKDDYHSMAMDKANLENEVETLRSTLRETEDKFSEKISEISRLKTHVESVDEKTKSLKEQLQKKELQLQQQNQTRTWNVEYELLELRNKDLQRQYDKIKDEYESMVKDRTKLENEKKKLMSMLTKTGQEISEKANNIASLKKDVESWVKEATSLKTPLQEQQIQLKKQEQERHLNVENEQLRMRHKELQQKFDTIKDDCQSMAMDKTNLENEIEKLRRMLRETEDKFLEKTREISRLKKHVDIVDEETKSLKEQLQAKEMQLHHINQTKTFKVEYEQLELSHKDLQRKLDKTKDESQALRMDKTKLKNENEKLNTMLRKSGQESLEQKNEISRLKKRVEKMDQESESLKANLHEKERQLQEQRLATKKAYAEKDDALTRLSRHMGQQMSEGNPNITDLSDQNRPSKLGERYSELYDNEWTDAFEVLTNNFGKDIDDKSAVGILRNILLESYKCVLDFSISQMKEAEDKLSGSSKGVSLECKRLLKEARKHIDIKGADRLIVTVLEGSLRKVIDGRYLNESMVNVFATECVQLCWFMSIQDPPVALAKEPIQGSRFDTNMYKQYTNSGDTVDYVVWPALLLHKNGPLLTKGVAQPFPRSTQMLTSAPLGENKMTDDRAFDKKSRSLFGKKYNP